MKKKYIIAILILILVFSCGKKNKGTRNSKNNVTVENKMNDKIMELRQIIKNLWNGVKKPLKIRIIVQ